jgi:hypothetical protein
VLLCLCAAAPLAAQGPTDVVGTAARAGLVFDGYYFGSRYAFDHVVEWTVPVSLSHRLSPSLTVDLSSAYAHAAAATSGGTLELSGATDTDVRMSWAAVSGRVIVSVAGTLPTGKKSVDTSSVPLLSALATEVLNFTTPSFGTGGGVTGGFATAFKVGERWAAGVGGSYRWRAAYTPVAGSGDLEPGGEGRVRFGVEGPVAAGGTGYFRGAVVYAGSGVDTLDAGSRSVSGGRLLVYSGVNLPAGRGTLSLYLYDRYRFRPHGYDSTVVQVPRGNVLALGARLERPLSAALRLAPNVEFRNELAPSKDGGLALLGWLVRPGVDVRYRAGGAVTMLVQGQAAFGRLANNGTSVSLVGPRAAVVLEWTR